MPDHTTTTERGGWYNASVRSAAYLIGIFVAVASASIGLASPLSTVVLDNERDEYLVGSSAEWLGDPDGDWQVDDVMSPQLSGKFRSSQSSRPSFGYRYDAVWLRFELQNATGHNPWVLEAAREWIDEAVLYRVASQGAEVLATWVRHDDDKQQSLVRYRPVLEFSLPSEEAQTLLLEVRATGTSIAFHGTLSSLDSFVLKQARYAAGFNVFYGALAVVALFNLLLWSSLRHPGFLALSATLLAYGFGELGCHNHFALLGLTTGLDAPKIGGVSMALVGATNSWLVRTMLNTRLMTPKLDILLRGIIGFFIFIAIAAAMGFVGHFTVFTALGFGVPPLLAAGFIRAAQRDADSIAFIVALTAWVVPASAAMAGILGMVPEVPAVENAAHFGAIVMLLLLSFVVARQVHRVNFAATRFVPQEFLSLLGRGTVADLQLGDATRRVMTILFADVRNFTTASESRSPEQNIEWLNRYLEIAEPPIRKAGGFVNQFYGDGIVALFGDADDAVKASFDLISQLQTAGDLGDGVPVSIGIGLHTGPLMLGTIGDSNRLDTGVVGDAVNTAARIESYTKEYQRTLLISDATEAALRDRDNLVIESVDSVVPKGKTEAITLFTVSPRPKST